MSGSVTYEGTPVANGSISFAPSDGVGPTTGGTIENGRYEVDEITSGKKVVQIVGVKVIEFATSSAEMEQQAKDAAGGRVGYGAVDQSDEISPNAEGNNVTIEITAGETYDFELKKPAKR